MCSGPGGLSGIVTFYWSECPHLPALPFSPLNLGVEVKWHHCWLQVYFAPRGVKLFQQLPVGQSPEAVPPALLVVQEIVASWLLVLSTTLWTLIAMDINKPSSGSASPTVSPGLQGGHHQTTS